MFIFIAFRTLENEIKIKRFLWIDKLLNQSKLTKEEAESIGNKIKSEIRKRFL